MAASAPGAKGQTTPSPNAGQPPQSQPSSDSVTLTNPPSRKSDPSPVVSSPLQPLFDFQESDVKFNLTTLTNTLRDSRHEGWVLAAYPDPKTSRPLIGAGFSLDVAATEHLQHDPLNPYPFIEPSSAQLWQSAGLDAAPLQAILDQYDRDLKKWKKKNYRRKIRTHQLQPEITGEEATSLLRISAIQAVHNAKAYCRNFDQLTASQQMALSQLVYQMGVNLEEFVEFLTAMNDGYPDAAQPQASIQSEDEHWKEVQRTLIQSQWARRYTSRAVTVIAMFDPRYAQNPREAEREVQAKLRPPAHHRKKPHTAPA
jgi:GH24 family phage-related lysozyme (muramidase)